jgi:hypothetical protein
MTITIPFTARAEYMADIHTILQQLLAEPAITRVMHSYNAELGEFGDGVLNFVLRCDQRPLLQTAVGSVIARFFDASENDDLHVLYQTLNFTDDFDGERTEIDLNDRILRRLGEKMRVSADI